MIIDNFKIQNDLMTDLYIAYINEFPWLTNFIHTFRENNGKGGLIKILNDIKFDIDASEKIKFIYGEDAVLDINTDNRKKQSLQVKLVDLEEYQQMISNVNKSDVNFLNVTYNSDLKKYLVTYSFVVR